MNGSPTTDGVPATPPNARRARHLAALARGLAPPGAQDLTRHAMLAADGRPKSGRCGAYVYYMFRGRLCWRRYVVPNDPRTAAQQSLRAAFGAASRTWSHSNRLTDQQRDAWTAEAGKVQSRPRLGTSGPLTPQQGFVSCNCGAERIGSEMLWVVPRRRAQQPETRNRRTQFPLQVLQAQRLAHAASGTPHPSTVPTPSPRRGATHRVRHSRANFVSSQAVHSQRVTQPSSERPQTYTGALPVCRRWEAGFALRAFGPSLLTGSVSCRREALPARGTGRNGPLNPFLRRRQVSRVVVRYENPMPPSARWPVYLRARRWECSAA
jgi:hypothetical protein